MKKLFLISFFLLNYSFSQATSGEEPKTARTTKADEFFLGEWDSIDDIYGDLRITKTDTLIGSYKLNFFFYRNDDVEAYANLEDNGEKLVINQGYGTINAENKNSPAEVLGEIVKENKGIKFTITKTEHPFLKLGGVFNYEKRGQAKIKEAWLIGQFNLNTELSTKNYPVNTYNFCDNGTWNSIAINNDNVEIYSGIVQKVVDTEGFIKYNLMDNENNFIKEFIFTRDEKGNLILNFINENAIFKQFNTLSCSS